MSDKPKPLYARRDTESLCEFYLRHVAAMTAEGLHEKSAIAAELAHRDAVIAELLEAIAGLLSIERSVTQGQESELRAKWMPEAARLVKGASNV